MPPPTTNDSLRSSNLTASIFFLTLTGETQRFIRHSTCRHFQLAWQRRWTSLRPAKNVPCDQAPTLLLDQVNLPYNPRKPNHIQFTKLIMLVYVGGYIASILTKYATAYASQHPEIDKQTDARSSVAQFYRPAFIHKDITLRLREVSIGKAWSTLRVEAHQGNKVAASVDVMYEFSVCRTATLRILTTFHPVSLISQYLGSI